jgi:hypothetical protein
MKRRVVSLVVFLALATGAPVAAGAPEDEDALVDALKGTPPQVQERLLEGVLSIYMWKMTEAVALTDEQASQTFPKIRESFQARWRSAARRRALLRTFERAIEAPANRKVRTERVDRLLSAWEENEAKLRDAQRGMLEALKKVLTSEQKVKYLLFEERFQGDLIRVVDEIRRERAQRLGEQPGQKPQ